MMKKRTMLMLLCSHAIVAASGFALGIYALPIITAPPAPTHSMVAEAARNSDYVGQFTRDRQDSDALHWGEGEVSISATTISFMGKLAPGPDYKLYLSPRFVETEAGFNELKSEMALVADIKTFENFVVSIPRGVDPSQYQAVIVWCETFGQFITSGRYQAKSNDA